MVNQGDIIKVNLNPTVGHEQRGSRPALVVSRTDYNRITGMPMICAITNTKKDFPTRKKLPENLQTTGQVLCDSLRTLDINSRGYKHIETVPKDFIDDINNFLKSILKVD